MMKLIILLIVIVGFSGGKPRSKSRLLCGAFVHLFERKFADVAEECERFLGPMGYTGVEVSPITESYTMTSNKWLENYQPLSYNIISKLGNENDFKNMIERCRAVNVDVYVDTVLNHMTPAVSPAVGFDGSIADGINKYYPGVPFKSSDFHQTCAIVNYKNATEVRNCQLIGMNDLDQSNQYVRNVLINFMQSVVRMGVAGFR